VYLLFLCPKCGEPRYAKDGQKTAICFKCAYRILLERGRIRILFQTEKRREVIETLQQYKKSGEKTEKKVFKGGYSSLDNW